MRTKTFLGIMTVSLLPAAASAQEMTIDPSGWSPPPAAPAPAAPAAPVIMQMPAPTDGGGAAAATSGYYYTDDAGLNPLDGEEQSLAPAGGPTPDVHVVRKGDTLWDICGVYFSNPWSWPKVWSLNPTITNPHWIYPGDVVRLAPEGEGGADPGQPSAAPAAALRNAAAEPAPRSDLVELRQLAFVSIEDLKVAGTIVGAPEEKELLATNDEFYVRYPDGKPPQVNQRYAIYSTKQSVVHPETGQTIGAYVEVVGEGQILDVKKGKNGRGILTYANGIVERGQRVGVLKTQFRQVGPTPADRDLEGVIVGGLGKNKLFGADHVVFIDRGAEHGVKPGNRLYVVRRGDAYNKENAADWGVGRDDRRFPEDVIAQITVIDTSPRTSLAVINASAHETEKGDHVVMRKGR